VHILVNFAAVTLLASLVAGCGGDDSSTAADPGQGTSTSSTASASSTPSNGATAGSGLTVTDGITPDDLVSCLTAAGIDAELSDATPLGIDVPVAEIDLSGMADYSGDTDQGGYLYVFADPDTAMAQASAVTLGGSDDPDNSRFAIHKNVVRALSIVVSEASPSADEQALFGCLPPATQRGGPGEG
jgi:hypothetical protein